MSQEQIYTYNYTCDECGAEVIRSNMFYECPICKTVLCSKCHKKRIYHLCDWCFDRIPNELLVKILFSKIMILVGPLLVLFFPALEPAVSLLFTSTNPVLIMIIWTVLILSILIPLIFLIYFTKRVTIVLKNDGKPKVSKTDRNKDSQSLSEAKDSSTEEIINVPIVGKENTGEKTEVKETHYEGVVKEGPTLYAKRHSEEKTKEETEEKESNQAPDVYQEELQDKAQSQSSDEIQEISQIDIQSPPQQEMQEQGEKNIEKEGESSCDKEINKEKSEDIIDQEEKIENDHQEV